MGWVKYITGEEYIAEETRGQDDRVDGDLERGHRSDCCISRHAGNVQIHPNGS